MREKTLKMVSSLRQFNIAKTFTLTQCRVRGRVLSKNSIRLEKLISTMHLKLQTPITPTQIINMSSIARIKPNQRISKNMPWQSSKIRSPRIRRSINLINNRLFSHNFSTKPFPRQETQTLTTALIDLKKRRQQIGNLITSRSWQKCSAETLMTDKINLFSPKISHPIQRTQAQYSTPLKQGNRKIRTSHKIHPLKIPLLSYLIFRRPPAHHKHRRSRIKHKHKIRLKIKTNRLQLIWVIFSGEVMTRQRQTIIIIRGLLEIRKISTNKTSHRNSGKPLLFLRSRTILWEIPLTLLFRNHQETTEEFNWVKAITSSHSRQEIQTVSLKKGVTSKTVSHRILLLHKPRRSNSSWHKQLLQILLIRENRLLLKTLLPNSCPRISSLKTTQTRRQISKIPSNWTPNLVKWI